MFKSHENLKILGLSCALVLAILTSGELAHGKVNVVNVNVNDTMQWHPPLKTGDKEFDGNGPKVQVRVSFFIRNNAVYRNVYMSAIETGDFANSLNGKKTEAYGGAPHKLVWRPPVGQILRRIVKPLGFVVLDTTLHGHGDHVFPTRVGRVTVWGDRYGSDVGYTGVKIEFDYQLRVVTQDGDRPIHSKVQLPVIGLRTKLIRGDGEFDGNGPHVTVSASLANYGTQVLFFVSMTAKETKADWTTGAGTVIKVVYEAPPGRRIKSISGRTQWNNIVDYIDTDHATDIFDTELGRFYVYGDHNGKDVPYFTGVSLRPEYSFWVVTVSTARSSSKLSRNK